MDCYLASDIISLVPAKRKLETRSCTSCNKPITRRPCEFKRWGKVFCEWSCWMSYHNKEISKQKRIILICQICKIQFETTICAKSKKFCSQACMGIACRKRRNVICKFCGKIFEVSIKYRKLYCNQKCFHDYRILIDCKHKYKNTSIEIKLQQFLKSNVISFSTHSSLFGRPDIFIEPNICIFADGDYWHNIPVKKNRDVIVNKYLKKNKYIVLRFWEHDINDNFDKCSRKILKTIENKKASDNPRP